MMADSPGDPRQLLTRRELEVVRLLVKGVTHREIAHALSIAVKTVREHVSAIHDKLDLRSRRQVVEWAVARGMVDIRSTTSCQTSTRWQLRA